MLRNPNLAAGEFSFKLNGIASESYSILYQDSLTDPTWQKWQNVPAQSTDHVVTVNVPTGAATNRFFKVVTPQLP